MLDDSFKLKFKTVPLMCTEENRDVKLHNHEEFEILLFTEGSPEVMVQNRLYRVGVNDMIFINPLEVHSVKQIESPYSLKCICFSPSLISNEKIRKSLTDSPIQITHYFSARDTDVDYLRELFFRICEAYERSDEWAEAEISSYLTLLFSHLLRTDRITQKANHSKSSAFCLRTLKYIAEHYTEHLTSADVAKAISYSHGYFCRKFRAEFEQSFSEYLTLYRISLSKILLKEKNQTVTDAAYLCGFNSTDYYTVCFKRLVGCSPSDYKKQGKEPSAL